MVSTQVKSREYLRGMLDRRMGIAEGGNPFWGGAVLARVHWLEGWRDEDDRLSINANRRRRGLLALPMVTK